MEQATEIRYENYTYLYLLRVLVLLSDSIHDPSIAATGSSETTSTKRITEKRYSRSWPIGAAARSLFVVDIFGFEVESRMRWTAMRCESSEMVHDHP